MQQAACLREQCFVVGGSEWEPIRPSDTEACHADAVSPAGEWQANNEPCRPRPRASCDLRELLSESAPRRVLRAAARHRCVPVVTMSETSKIGTLLAISSTVIALNNEKTSHGRNFLPCEVFSLSRPIIVPAPLAPCLIGRSFPVSRVASPVWNTNNWPPPAPRHWPLDASIFSENDLTKLGTDGSIRSCTVKAKMQRGPAGESVAVRSDSGAPELVTESAPLPTGSAPSKGVPIL